MLIAASSTCRWEVTHSTASGAIYADVPPGEYRVTLAHPGFGSKHLQERLGGPPLSLRLLRDGLMGFVWPKWSRGGEQARGARGQVAQCQRAEAHALEP